MILRTFLISRLSGDRGSCLGVDCLNFTFGHNLFFPLFCFKLISKGAVPVVDGPGPDWKQGAEAGFRSSDLVPRLQGSPCKSPTSHFRACLD